MTNPTTAKMMGRIQALLNKADSTTFPPEAAEFRAKAEELMQKYRIAEEEMLATDPTSAEPVLHTMVIHTNRGSRFAWEYVRLMGMACDHAGVRVGFHYAGREIIADMVGYDGDLRMAEWVYSAARLMFQAKLEPEIDHALSDQVNVYNLRQAGILRKDVAWMMWGENTSPLRSRVSALYKRECAVRGETPALEGVNAGDFRQAYARGFGDRFASRLRQARDAANSVGGGVVLHGRAERITEAFYQHFPHLRPTPPSDAPAVPETAPAKKAKAPKPYKPTQADIKRAHRMFYSQAARAGTLAGSSAAAQVELDRTKQAQRLGE